MSKIQCRGPLNDTLERTTMTTKTPTTPIDTLVQLMAQLQNTYIELLKKDEVDAYTEVGLTLRNYSDSLSMMLDPYTDDDTEDDMLDDE